MGPLEFFGLIILTALIARIWVKGPILMAARRMGLRDRGVVRDERGPRELCQLCQHRVRIGINCTHEVIKYCWVCEHPVPYEPLQYRPGYEPQGSSQRDPPLALDGNNVVKLSLWRSRRNFLPPPQPSDPPAA
jgi:hypothetical protein